MASSILVLKASKAIDFFLYYILTMRLISFPFILVLWTHLVSLPYNIARGK